MSRKRSILLHGLSITLRRLPAFLWTYVFSLMIAIIFSYPLKVQLSNLLDHSLAAQRLATGFDLGTAVSAGMQLRQGANGHSITAASQGSVPVYFLIYFVLVPGTLFCYITRTHSRLSTLLRHGVMHFWRFVRITLLALLTAVLILGPLAALQSRWSAFIDDRFVGKTSIVLRLCGLAVVLLAASLLRLYFDLVEAYTVQLGAEHRSDGKHDRRVRKTLKPALDLLRRNFVRAWSVFLLLAVLGAVMSLLATRTAIHMLAQPRVWPMFLVAQLGMLALLFARFWQRGAEASLVLQHPLSLDEEGSRVPFAHKTSVVPPPAMDHPQHIETTYNNDPLAPSYPAPLSGDDILTNEVLHMQQAAVPDPIPDPEPAAPSLDEPDPGVFHHEPHKPES